MTMAAAMAAIKGDPRKEPANGGNGFIVATSFLETI
jgi:hypothetical protein